MANLDNRISNPDQLLTVDVVKFCDTFTDLYSNVSKPMLDIGLYVYRLTSGLGGKVFRFFQVVYCVIKIKNSLLLKI